MFQFGGSGGYIVKSENFHMGIKATGTYVTIFWGPDEYRNKKAERRTIKHVKDIYIYEDFVRKLLNAVDSNLFFCPYV